MKNEARPKEVVDAVKQLQCGKAPGYDEIFPDYLVHLGQRSINWIFGFFGVTPEVSSIIWEKLKDELPEGSEPKHLLWSLLFLKQYCDEHNRRSILGADEKTIRKWTWVLVELLYKINVVLLL